LVNGCRVGISHPISVCIGAGVRGAGTRSYTGTGASSGDPDPPTGAGTGTSDKKVASSGGGGHAEASSDRVGAGLRGDGTAPRFYKTVDVVRLEGGWGVALDGKTLKTPKRAPLSVPSKSLALAIAAEWAWQSGRSIRPFTMPLMALVSTAVNQMTLGEVRDLHIRKLLEYFASDVTLCRAEPGPLAERQKDVHGPILEWARSELGPVTPSESIFGAEQPDEVP